MAKVFIEETTLTAIGDAIREKEGSTELIPVTDMSTRISAISGGSDPIIESLEITTNGTYTAPEGVDGYSPITVSVPQDGAPTAEELTFTGACSFLFAHNNWNWFINKYGNQIVVKDVTVASSMFNSATNLTEIPFSVSVVQTSGNSYPNLSSMFSYCQALKSLPPIHCLTPMKPPTNTYNYVNLADMLNSCYEIVEVPDDYLDEIFTEEYTAGAIAAKCNGSNNARANCHSLRKVGKLTPWMCYSNSNYNSLYYGMLNCCYVLDEITDIPIERWCTYTSNAFSNTFQQCNRLKRITFALNPETNAPYEVNWKSQTIDLSKYVGYATGASNVLQTSAGITKDKEVKDDATYQALKNDPDWFTIKFEYCRYNHDSAVETINSLPDTSAYLASAGGTNTIKFGKLSGGSPGSLTDGGAVNTLTAEEIAVATAKGWTVTFG